MMALYKNVPEGYGEKDKKLSDDLGKARSPEEADKIAREDGHENAEDAINNWLAPRSPESGKRRRRT